jgi:hypothetical protein
MTFSFSISYKLLIAAVAAFDIFALKTFSLLPERSGREIAKARRSHSFDTSAQLLNPFA